MSTENPKGDTPLENLSVSPRRREANRRNALRSTGPKSIKGKNRVRWNSLKHGLLSKAVVITDGAGAEDGTEFKRLLAVLRNDLEPAGIIEEMLVERIAICYWRLRRALRCENGEIRTGFVKHFAKSAFDDLDVLCSGNRGRSTIGEHLSIPSIREMDKILRYETTIHRQLNQAISQLDKLQHARKGSQVPPPIDVQVTGGE